VIWDLVARTGDRSALRRVDHVSQLTGRIGFVLLVIGLAAGFGTAISGDLNLLAPWLLIAYVLVASDLLVLRWASTHVARVRAAQNDEAQDLRRIARGTRANATLIVVVAIWVLLIADMIIKPFS
jgi:4-hydroxybenzoate polyprenyltransferase